MPFPDSRTNQPCKYGHVSERDRYGACKECKRIRSREYRAKDPERYKNYKRKYKTENPERFLGYCRTYYAKYPEKVMLQSARKRAKAGGYVCTITVADIVIPEFCPLLKIKLERLGTRATFASPSLDKIRPHLGYVPGNVWVISHRANDLKRDATLQELQMLVSNLARYVL